MMTYCIVANRHSASQVTSRVKSAITNNRQFFRSQLQIDIDSNALAVTCLISIIQYRYCSSYTYTVHTYYVCSEVMSPLTLHSIKVIREVTSYRLR